MSDRPRDDGERYRTLLEINNALVSNLRRDSLFRAIATALRRVVAFDRTAVFLHDAARGVLRLFILESSLASTYFTVGFEMPVAGSHVGRVFERQEPFRRADLARERQYPTEEMAYGDGVRSYAIVPLIERRSTLEVWGPRVVAIVLVALLLIALALIVRGLA